MYKSKTTEGGKINQELDHLRVNEKPEKIP
jgi:hypothetical protein